MVSVHLRQDGVCLDRLHDQHVQRAMVHAEGDRECRGLLGVAPQLGLLHAAVCAGSVLVHEPAELDEEPVRVGVLLLKTVELFQALGGLLAAHAHAMQELLHPGEMAQIKINRKTIQTVTSLFFLETNMSYDGPHRSRSMVISAS